MHSGPAWSAPTSRRTVLRSALGLAGAGVVGASALGVLSGCDAFGGGDPPAPDPLEGFIAATVALGDRYGAAIKAVPALEDALTPIRDAHRAHAEALGAAVGAAVGTTPKPAASAPRVPAAREQAIADLKGAEQEARDEAVNACMAATARMAPLLGAIAAARETHLVVLA